MPLKVFIKFYLLYISGTLFVPQPTTVIKKLLLVFVIMATNADSERNKNYVEKYCYKHAMTKCKISNKKCKVTVY